MTTPQQINYAKQVGYEHGYLKAIGQPSDRMTLETTSQEQFKHNKELSKAWQEGETKYYQDMQNGLDEPTNVSELKVGEHGPFVDFYKKKAVKNQKDVVLKKKERPGGLANKLCFLYLSINFVIFICR